MGRKYKLPKPAGGPAARKVPEWFERKAWAKLMAICPSSRWVADVYAWLRAEVLAGRVHLPRHEKRGHPFDVAGLLRQRGAFPPPAEHTPMAVVSEMGCRPAPNYDGDQLLPFYYRVRCRVGGRRGAVAVVSYEVALEADRLGERQRLERAYAEGVARLMGVSSASAVNKGMPLPVSTTESESAQSFMDIEMMAASPDGVVIQEAALATEAEHELKAEIRRYEQTGQLPAEF